MVTLIGSRIAYDLAIIMNPPYSKEAAVHTKDLLPTMADVDYVQDHIQVETPVEANKEPEIEVKEEVVKKEEVVENEEEPQVEEIEEAVVDTLIDDNIPTDGNKGNVTIK
jgi:hypothetical protein